MYNKVPFCRFLELVFCVKRLRLRYRGILQRHVTDRHWLLPRYSYTKRSHIKIVTANEMKKSIDVQWIFYCDQLQLKHSVCRTRILFSRFVCARSLPHLFYQYTGWFKTKNFRCLYVGPKRLIFRPSAILLFLYTKDNITLEMNKIMSSYLVQACFMLG